MDCESLPATSKEEMESDERAASTETTVKTWFSLHGNLLNKICSFLNNPNRRSVCEAFHILSRGIELPCWKYFVFVESLYKWHEVESFSTIMAKVCGFYFKTVVLYFPEYKSRDLYGAWLGHFFVFLQTLSKTSSLEAIHFRKLENCLEYCGDPYCNYIGMLIGDFLGSQRELKELSFSDCSFHLSDGIRVLEKAIHSDSAIVHLKLTRFLDWEIVSKMFWSLREDVPDILSLPNLETLHMDYRLIFGRKSVWKLIESHESLRKRRKKLKLVIHLDLRKFFSRYIPFEPNQWILLLRENYNLDAEMIVNVNSTFWKALKWLFETNPPIAVLNCTFNPSIRDYNLDEIVSALSTRGINRFLRSLTFKFERRIENWGESFANNLLNFPNLEDIDLFLLDPRNDLGIFLDKLYEQTPPSLKTVAFAIRLYKEGPEDTLELIEPNKDRFRDDRSVEVIFYEVIEFNKWPASPLLYFQRGYYS